MLELGTPGSVRGVFSNGHPYRNPRSTWAECGLIDDGALRRSASDRGRPLSDSRHCHTDR